MKFGLREEIYQKILNIVSNHNCKFVVFGSRARGDYRNNSDIDIAIIDRISENEKYGIRNEFDEIDMEYTVDIVFLDEIKKEELIQNIMKEGVEIKWHVLKKEKKII